MKISSILLNKHEFNGVKVIMIFLYFAVFLGKLPPLATVEKSTGHRALDFVLCYSYYPYPLPYFAQNMIWQVIEYFSCSVCYTIKYC